MAVKVDFLNDIGASTNGISRRSLLAGAAALGTTTLIGSFPAIARAKPPLKIAMANNVMTVVYPYVTNAQVFGLFDAQDVDVEVVMGQGTPQVLSLLTAGTVDLVFANPEPMARLDVERGMKLKSVFAGQQSQYILAVTEDSPIQSVSDLKGKRIGMFSPESGIDYLRARLMDEGMSVEDVQIIPTGFGGQAVAAVNNNQVDAVMYWTDALVMMGQAGLKLRKLPKAEWEAGFYQYVGVTKQETIDNNADTLSRVVRAFVQGQMLSFIAPKVTVEGFWKQHPDQEPRPGDREKALESNVGRLQAYNAEQGLPLDASKEQIMEHQWGAQNLPVWTRMQEAMLRVKLISKKIDPQDLFDNSFTEEANKFDREALFQKVESLK
jgi:NitT/TauT family transport system substrate-binding protein